MQVIVPYSLALASALTCCIFLRLLRHLSDPKCLRKYPSVLPLAGLTNLVYIVFNQRATNAGLTRTEALLAPHQEHHILRLGPSRLSFAKPQAIKDIYGTGTKCIKGDLYTTIGGTPNLLSVVDKQTHSVKRKRLSRAFATMYLLEWKHKVASNVAKLCEQLDKRADRGLWLDFRYWSNLFTLDAIMSIALNLDTSFMQAESAICQIPASGGRAKTIDAMECLRSMNRAIDPYVWSKSIYRASKALAFMWSNRRELWEKAADWQVYVASLVIE